MTSDFNDETRRRSDRRHLYAADYGPSIAGSRDERLPVPQRAGRRVDVQAVIDAERNPESFVNAVGIPPDAGRRDDDRDGRPQHLLRRKLVTYGFTPTREDQAARSIRCVTR